MTAKNEAYGPRHLTAICNLPRNDWIPPLKLLVQRNQSLNVLSLLFLSQRANRLQKSNHAGKSKTAFRPVRKAFVVGSLNVIRRRTLNQSLQPSVRRSSSPNVRICVATGCWASLLRLSKRMLTISSSVGRLPTLTRVAIGNSSTRHCC